MLDSFNVLDSFSSSNKTYKFFNLNKLSPKYDISKLPYSLKLLLENLLRFEDSSTVSKQDIEAIINWNPSASPNYEIAYRPSRVILQDFTGVPAIVDLAAMRDAMKKLNGDPNKINPLSPVELVIDHSVMVDSFGQQNSFRFNVEKEYSRNKERYTFLRWGQTAFNNFKVVPPGTGIVHQVNLEYLARVTFSKQINGENYAYPDTLVGTDSHTTMVNGLGVLAWGVGGIEAEAAMLGQPITMLIPQVVGFKLDGKLPEGITATDLVLTVVEMLRKKGVVGKFVEFYGDGLDNLTLEDRATISNMAPEYGATCGIFPIDDLTIKYLKLTGRTQEQLSLIEDYSKKVGFFRTKNSIEANYSDKLELNLKDVLPCIAGPKRPQDKVYLKDAKNNFNTALKAEYKENLNANASIKTDKAEYSITHGDVVIAAITSCTNTSNPSVMVAAGLVAKKAVELGIAPKPWVKTSLAPGSQVVTDYYKKSGLDKYLEAIGFNLVGYGCTTCIGNSGPLPEEISHAIKDNKLASTAVLSGNRNFEGRIHPDVKFSYLASPPLVVIYALAGTINIDLNNDPIAQDKNGRNVFFKDLWPDIKEVQDIVATKLTADMFNTRYAKVYEGDENWQTISVPESELYNWDDNSTYVKNPPFFDDIANNSNKINDISDARVLVFVGDSVTTDHISPAGSIAVDSPAGKYLLEHGVELSDFNSYGSRRGNHEVMMRGTFANIRLRNKLVPGTEGGFTKYLKTNTEMPIFDAAMNYSADNTPLIVIAGKEYGSGSSRDWAAKGPRLLGIKAAIAESFEKIHRSNLIGMGILPLQFKDGDSADSLGLDGTEVFNIKLDSLKPQGDLTISCSNPQSNKDLNFNVKVRIDTPKELEYYKHGGILQYVLKQLARDNQPQKANVI